MRGDMGREMRRERLGRKREWIQTVRKEEMRETTEATVAKRRGSGAADSADGKQDRPRPVA